MVDSRPLLQDKPPAYNSVPGAYAYGPQQQSYGAIPATAPAPPPYPYPAGQGKYFSPVHLTNPVQTYLPKSHLEAR